MLPRKEGFTPEVVRSSSPLLNARLLVDVHALLRIPLRDTCTNIWRKLHQLKTSFRASHSFATLPLFTNRKEKEAAQHSEAAALEYETFATAPLGVSERKTSSCRTASYKSANLDALLMDSCMTLAHGGAHTVSFDHLERVHAINTSAAR